MKVKDMMHKGAEHVAPMAHRPSEIYNADSLDPRV